MKKDGTKYLALVRFRNNKEEWCVVYWGTSCGLSGHQPGWISRMFKLRDPKFLEYYELEHSIKVLRIHNYNK